MTFPANYASGNIIFANDINSAIGNIDSLNPYPSSAAANLRVAALWGVGFGNYGYGQTVPVLSPVSVSSIITSTTWINLRNSLYTMLQHYYGNNTPVTSLPPVSALSTGQIITAHSGSNPFNFNNEIILINNNRNNFLNNAAKLNSTTLTSNVITVTRTTQWGVSPNNGIQSEIDVIFPNENSTRYFFNSGGEIIINFNQTGLGNAKSANWANIFTNRIGTVIFSANRLEWTGTYPGSPNLSGGYYNITNVYTTQFNGINIGTGPYSMNDVFIDIRYSSGTTINGARGSVVRFRFRLIDEHANPYPYFPYGQPVLPNTSVTFSHRRATTYISGIVTPSYNIVSPWVNI
ncbi:MAG: hypothetical protein NZZ41_00080 [Candidatus Dojkabacteria bacterium]|nr:hypothetical protein [Candidatus Dojkabacteria bacterium]